MAKHSCEKQSEIQQAGILGSLNSADYCREVGRYNYIHAEQEELIHIDKGRELSAEVRAAAIEAGYTGDGPPLISVPNNGVWNCNGVLDEFECAKDVNVNATDIAMLKLLINHNLLEPDCNVRKPNGEYCEGIACRLVALKDNAETT